MADKTNSQAQKGMKFFNNLLEGQFDRVDAWYEQVEEMQKKGFEQADEALENAASLNRASIKYAQELSQDFFKLSLDAFRQTTQMFDRD